MADFTSFQTVSEWIEQQEDGVDELRRAIDTGRFAGQNMSLARAWLAQHDRQLFDQERAASLEATQRATAAAERAARWTFWAALFSGVAGVATLAATILQAMSTKP